MTDLTMESRAARSTPHESPGRPAHLTLGTPRGLQQLADRDGIFAICAADPDSSPPIAGVAAEGVRSGAPGEAIAELRACLALAGTAAPLDPSHGAARAIASGALPGTTGRLVGLAEAGDERDGQRRATELLANWSVAKTRRMGAPAASLRLYYHPDLLGNAGQQREVVRQVAADCARADLPFLLEPPTYPRIGEGRDPGAFAACRPGLIVRSARELTPCGVDVLLAKFSDDSRESADGGRLLAACQRLHAAPPGPVVLVSGAAAFEAVARQVRLACQAGASWFLVGRAIRAEAARLRGRRAQRAWLTTVGVDRRRRLRAIVGEGGWPWWRKWADTPRALVAVEQDWDRRY